MILIKSNLRRKTKQSCDTKHSGPDQFWLTALLLHVVQTEVELGQVDEDR